MNIIAFYEFNPDDFDTLIKKFQEVTADRETKSNKYPNLIFGPTVNGGKWGGLAIYDNPTEEQLNALMIQYKGILSWKFVPMTDGANFIKQYMKSK